MALSYKARKRWALFVLILGIPFYIVVAITGVDLMRDWFGRPAILLEFLLFLVLGIAWAFPLKTIFKGIGQADPDAPLDDL
ncbi:MAG: DUF2842 domain-containing protein [Pseudomonadota bacterium]